VVRRQINHDRQRGTGTVDRLPRQVPTELIDLTGISLAALRTCDKRLLAASLDRVLRQLDRPRGNIRESGPPGRVD
jgi:FXSXX-COOH protein